MATKKKTGKRKKVSTARKNKGLSAAKRAMSKRKRSRPRRRGGLSEIASAESWQDAGNATLSGAIGGAVAYTADRLMPNGWGTGARAIGFTLLSGLTAVVMKKPRAAAGIAGGGAVIVLDELLNKTLSEEAAYADINALSEMPMFLDEAGNAMYLNEDGELSYLQEGDERAYLQESVQMYPGYYNQY